MNIPEHAEIPIDSATTLRPAASPDAAPSADSSAKKKKKRKPNPRGPKKGSEQDPSKKNVAGPKDTLAMLAPIVLPESVPPPSAQLRNQRRYQSVQTSTLFFFVLALEQIVKQLNMIDVPPTFTMFPLSFDGALFASLICLAIGVKCAAVAEAAVGFKLPHKLGRMYSQITKACAPYFTVSRGVVFARFFGFFSTPFYETTYPTFMTGATCFILLAAFLFLKHINRVYGKPNGWCQGMDWSELFPTAAGSKARAIPLDTPGNEVDRWFDFLTPCADRPNLHFLPVRPYVDHEDFRLTISGLSAAALANTLDCSVLHKGKMINEASPNVLVHHLSRDLVDTYYFETPDSEMSYTVVTKDMLIDETQDVEALPLIDPVYDRPHVPGGRFNQQVTVEDVFYLLNDITVGDCTRVASFFYDSSGVDVRTGALGRDAPRIEALMLIQMYGGHIMYDETFLNAFNLFDDLYYSDGIYYQHTSTGQEMNTGDGYLKSFYDMQTFVFELIRGQFSILRERYLSYFKMFGIRIYSVTVQKLTGSTTQLYSYLKNTSNQISRIFTSPFDNGTNLPSIEGSSQIAKVIQRNDAGSILGPSISIERTVACSFTLPEGRVAVAQYLVRKPWDDMDSNWNEYPTGFN